MREIIKKILNKIILLLLVTILLGCGKSEIDYSETTWLEITGYKSKGYDVSMLVGYGGEGDNCNFFSFGLGESVNKSTRMPIQAKISEDDLHYTLRYPLNFKQGVCEFWAGGMEISMQEYNNLDIKKYPRNEDYRTSKIFDSKVLVLSLTYQKDTYKDNFNLNPLNLYCQRDLFYFDIAADDTDERVGLFGAICHNTTSYRGMAGIIGADYSVEFLKKNSPLKANLLISEDLKCSTNCNSFDVQRAFFEHGALKKLYKGSIYDAPTSNILNVRFTPSEELFINFKKKYNIKE